jgi:hypothetical protein
MLVRARHRSDGREEIRDQDDFKPPEEWEVLEIIVAENVNPEDPSEETRPA